MDDVIGWWGGSVHDVTKETEKSPKENGKMLGVSGGCSSELHEEYLQGAWNQTPVFYHVSPPDTGTG